MPNFFKKLSNGSSNLFKKLDNGASNFFKKLPDQVNHISNQVGNGITSAGDQIAGVAKQVGNVLEKNSGLIADGVAGVAMAMGQPEISAGVLSLGGMGQQLGQRLKQGGTTLQGQTNNLAQIQNKTVNNMAGQASTLGLNGLNQVRTQLNPGFV